MSFRILNQAPQYLLPDGRVNAGGSLTFYETDLSTPKLTWSDAALATPNPNPVVLDAAGRSVTDIWGDGEYGVVMKGADGVPIWTRNNVRDVDNPGQAIPPLLSGQFLTNDGSLLQWQPILQVPDPTGSDTYILSNDGINPIWIPNPPPPDPEVVVEANSVQIGISSSPSKYLLQDGNSTAPASGAHTTQVEVDFPTAFSTTPKVLIEPTVAAVSSGGFLVAHSVISKSATGFTVKFDTNEDSGTLGNIINPVTFDWVAHGRITVEEAP